jgi:6-phosphogluconolactonase
MQEHHFATAPEMAQAQALAVAAQLQAALQARGQATLAVSGGRSPIALFESLRLQALDWRLVTVILVDERCVSASHADSNAQLVRTHLLQGAAAAARFIAYTEGEAPDPANADAWLSFAQGQLANLALPLDVVLLGMGDDGHTASWFPGGTGLAEALSSTRLLACVQPPAYAPHLRITLTQQAVVAARHIHLALAGAGKLQVYAQARQTASLDAPVSLVLHQAQRLDVWLAKEAS